LAVFCFYSTRYPERVWTLYASRKGPGGGLMNDLKESSSLRRL
jgi:hypothetical protein